MLDMYSNGITFAYKPRHSGYTEYSIDNWLLYLNWRMCM